MLVLNARFALLVAFCSLATMSFSSRWGVGAAAIQYRPFDHDHCHDVTSGQPSAQYVLPLPLQSKTKQFKVRTLEWLYANPVTLFADIVFTRLKRDDNTPGVACRFGKDGDYRVPAEKARRSVLIPDNHGSEYVVSHSRRPVHRRRRRSKARMLNRIREMPLSRRAPEDAMLGNVALMSPDDNVATGRQIATLYAAPSGPEAWILYASVTNKTEFRLVNTTSMESTSDLTPVTLEMGAPGETRTCATYDSSPPQDESNTQDSENMTMEPCADRATPVADYKSQVFLYNTTSGVLQPISNSSAEGTNTTSASASVNRNSTSSSNTTATSSAFEAAATLFANRADIAQNSTRQNSTVTLVFTPVKAMVANVGIEENSTTSRVTMTMTKTVTIFNVESTSTGGSAFMSNAGAQVTATSSALDVQLVGAPMPSSNATGTTIGSTSVSTPSSSPATGSIDPVAIASRIAASSTTVSSSSTASAPSSSTQAAQRRENGKLVASGSKVAIVTEPYTWMFKERA